MKVLILADDATSLLVPEIVNILKPHSDVLFVGTGHDEQIIQQCDISLIINAYINGSTIRIAELLVSLNKTILTFPSDPHKYSGKGTNFLIQTGNAQLVSCAEDIFSYLTPVLFSKSEISNSRVADQGQNFKRDSGQGVQG